MVLNEQLLFLEKHLQGLWGTHLSQPWNPIHLFGSWHIGTVHKRMDHVVHVPSHNGKPIHTETFFVEKSQHVGNAIYHIANHTVDGELFMLWL